MRRALPVLALLCASSPAFADSFGGFGGREDGYLVNRDKICAPLTVASGKASGAPSCARSTEDEVAHLSVKTAKAVRGRDASHTAAARGRALEITEVSSSSVIVTWEAPDPIAKVTSLYVSTYANLIAVEYTVRRGGKDVTEVVGFDVRGAGGATVEDKPPVEPEATVAPPPETPAVKKALKAARKAAKGAAKKALKAWQKVLALDPEHSEALHGQAVAQAKLKQLDDAMATLELLGASTRTDAIDWRVAARFDKAFAKIRSDARYRAAVGLDRPAATTYERLMGHGGVWEQAETSCDTAGVRLTLNRDRSFKIKVTTTCDGDKDSSTFKGTWIEKDATVVLTVPTKGMADSQFGCMIERDGDEDAIRCMDEAFTFVVHPVRR